LQGQPNHKSMKPINNILTIYKSNHFRNYSIVAGVILSLFIIFSFRIDNKITTQPNSGDLATIEQSVDEQNTTVAEGNQQEKYSAKYHNFLASYFLQESSVDRSKKKSEEKRNVISNIKELHHLIISRSWSIF